MERPTMVAAPKKFGRWAINKLDSDWLEVVILASEWNKDLVPTEISAENFLEDLQKFCKYTYIKFP